MAISGIVMITIGCVNLLLLLLMIFVERKQPQTILSWFVILMILPIVGFLLYLLFGGGLSIRVRLYIKRRKKYTQDYYKFTSWQRLNFEQKRNIDTNFDYAKHLIDFVKNMDNNIFSTGNSVQVFVSGEEKINSLKKDLMNAKQSINIEYYIFANDRVGKEIMQILCQKASSGVKVKLIYDSIGCLGTSRSFFKKLKKAGGEVVEFFPPFLGIRLINLKVNYRNHRKIVVIDGKIAYVGGMNIRDDHLGKRKKLCPWRDTHIRICGPAVWDLQNVFFNDYRCAKGSKLNPKSLINQGYFKSSSLNHKGNEGVQIVTSGPEDDDKYILDCYIKIINMAKERIYIQSPYFVPDDTFLKALVLAKKSGVDVKVMVPQKPDKHMVYYVTLSYVQQLLTAGIDVYLFEGFIHSKTLLVDDLVVSIGSCNADNRSFSLNFEVTALLYGKQFVNKNAKIFENDIKNSKRLTLNYFNKKFFATKSAQAIYRLFSPLM